MDLKVVERSTRWALTWRSSATICAIRGDYIFSPQIINGLFKPRYRKVNDALNIPWIMHTDGNFLPISMISSSSGWLASTTLNQLPSTSSS